MDRQLSREEFVTHSKAISAAYQKAISIANFRRLRPPDSLDFLQWREQLDSLSGELDVLRPVAEDAWRIIAPMIRPLYIRKGPAAHAETVLFVNAVAERYYEVTSGYYGEHTTQQILEALESIPQCNRARLREEAMTERAVAASRLPNKKDIEAIAESSTPEGGRQKKGKPSTPLPDMKSGPPTPDDGFFVERYIQGTVEEVAIAADCSYQTIRRKNGKGGKYPWMWKADDSQGSLRLYFSTERLLQNAESRLRDSF